MKKKSLVTILRIALGAIFIYASFDKILHPYDFAKAIYNYQILPDILINPAAIILPWTELLCGILLVFGIWYPGALFLVNLMLMIFMASLVFNFLRGVNVYCGCFSTSMEDADAASMIKTILRDSLFMVAGWFLFIRMIWDNKYEQNNTDKKGGAK